MILYPNAHFKKVRKIELGFLKENNINARVFVGGAVVTEEYAQKINADYYSKDAKSAVEIAKINFKFFKSCVPIRTS